MCPPKTLMPQSAFFHWLPTQIDSGLKIPNLSPTNGGQITVLSSNPLLPVNAPLTHIHIRCQLVDLSWMPADPPPRTLNNKTWAYVVCRPIGDLFNIFLWPTAMMGTTKWQNWCCHFNKYNASTDVDADYGDCPAHVPDHPWNYTSCTQIAHITALSVRPSTHTLENKMC